jgi:hypothetical protein
MGLRLLLGREWCWLSAVYGASGDESSRSHSSCHRGVSWERRLGRRCDEGWLGVGLFDPAEYSPGESGAVLEQLTGRFAEKASVDRQLPVCLTIRGGDRGSTNYFAQIGGGSAFYCAHGLLQLVVAQLSHSERSPVEPQQAAAAVLFRGGLSQQPRPPGPDAPRERVRGCRPGWW